MQKRGSRTPGGRLAAALLLVAAVVAPVGAATQAAAATVRPGFSDTVVAPVPSPTGLAVTPDGRALVATQPGLLRVVSAAGALLPTPALDLSARACTDNERGMLGVTIDPAFASNGFVYLFWTRKTGASCPTLVTTGLPENRVSRFTLRASGTIDQASEFVIIDHLPSFAGYHNAGDLRFGGDGLLYVSVGDSGCQLTASTRCGGENGNARRLDIPLGKILRVTRTGGIPPANPYAGTAGARHCTAATVPTGTGPCAETFASGLRNPFRIALRPGGSDFYVDDVGQTATEEVDHLARGADYGWNRCEGTEVTGSSAPCDLAGSAAPLLEYPHSTGCTSITGGAFVPGTAFGPASQGSYLYADYVCGKIFERRADGSVVTFVSDLGESSVVAMTFGPYNGTQALYYLSYFNGGSIHRIALQTGNTAPVAALTSRPADPAARSVTLDGSASYDPDGGDRVTSYRWDFGDGTTAQTTGPTVDHTYASRTPVTASLVVTDTHGAASAPSTRRIVPGDHVPTLTITGADPAHRYRVGEKVTLTAHANDTEDGPFPSAAIHWQVLLHHDTHTHPRGMADRQTITPTIHEPEDLAAAKTSYYEAIATVTDSAGHTVTTSVDLLPAKIDLTFTSAPAGHPVLVHGETLAAPSTVTSWVGWQLDLDAPPSGNSTCTGWSDGGACSHLITTPATATTYTATYTP